MPVTMTYLFTPGLVFHFLREVSAPTLLLNFRQFVNRDASPRSATEATEEVIKALPVSEDDRELLYKNALLTVGFNG